MEAIKENLIPFSISKIKFLKSFDAKCFDKTDIKELPSPFPTIPTGS